jgi:hypothetical protein
VFERETVSSPLTGEGRWGGRGDFVKELSRHDTGWAHSFIMAAEQGVKLSGASAKHWKED